jgi:hypothetical protein
MNSPGALYGERQGGRSALSGAGQWLIRGAGQVRR